MGCVRCISRTDIGETIVQKNISESVVKLEEIERDIITGSQGLFSASIIKFTKTVIFLYKLIDKDVPEYTESFNTKLFNLTFFNYVKVISLRLRRYFISKKIFWRFNMLSLPLEVKIVRRLLK
jgi:hypothetical protein